MDKTGRDPDVGNGATPQYIGDAGEKTKATFNAAASSDDHATIGDIDKVIADCTEAIRLDPKDARAYCNRSVAYTSKGDVDKAFADCCDAIRFNPKYAEA
jgi:tetratricopeptide (TPR) repeat protein